jgi:hypothetical protein
MTFCQVLIKNLISFHLMKLKSCGSKLSIDLICSIGVIWSFFFNFCLLFKLQKMYSNPTLILFNNFFITSPQVPEHSLGL